MSKASKKTSPVKPATRTSKAATPTYPRTTRPSIPQQTQRELWARAAGRCQFHGCNVILYLDSKTQQQANLATIAHIVAYSPEGPRGHPTRSKELEVDLKNLMLTCNDHGKLIDNLNYVDQYSEKTLLTYKENHEDRVREATAALDDAKTHLLIVRGRVNGGVTIIDEEETKRAMRPRWPDSEQGRIVDLNPLTLEKSKQSYWDAASEQITTEVQDMLRPRPGAQGVKHLSVFAIVPIPLLVLLGKKLSSRIDADLFQFQRGKATQKWCWNEGHPSAGEGFDLYVPDEPVAVEDVVIIASISGIVHRPAASSVVGQPHVIYEIRAQSPGFNFLKYRTQLSEFATMFRDVLARIQRDFKDAQRIHLILACPASMAIEAGRSLEYIHPETLVYEVFKKDGADSYKHVLTVNEKENT